MVFTIFEKNCLKEKHTKDLIILNVFICIFVPPEIFIRKSWIAPFVKDNFRLLVNQTVIYEYLCKIFKFDNFLVLFGCYNNANKMFRPYENVWKFKMRQKKVFSPFTIEDVW